MICIAFMTMLCAWNLNAQEFHTITVLSDPSQQCGEVFGGGIYSYGEVITVEAEPASDHFIFIHWSENDVPVSSESIYTFEVMEDRVLVAFFLQILYFTITMSANPPEGGVSWDIPSYYGQGIMVVMHTNPGYELVNWTEDGIEISTDESFLLITEKNHNLVANLVPGLYDVTVSADPPKGGEVFGGGVYRWEDEVTVRAVPNSGYKFLNWMDWASPDDPDGRLFSLNPEVTFNVRGNYNLVANFVPSSCEITLSQNIEEGGTVSGGGVYGYGQTVIVDAAYNLPEYMFANWTEDGNVVSSNWIYTFTATRSRHLVANFKTAVYEIKTYAKPYEGGSVTGGGVYHYGDRVSIYAVANSGYHFSHWEKCVSGECTVVSTNPDYTYVIEGSGWGSCAFFAYFEKGDESVSIDNVDTGALIIYPNPTNSDMMTVVLNDPALKIVEMELYDLSGKKVHQQVVNQSYGTLKLDGLAQGIYILKAFLNQGEAVVCRVVKQ